MISLLVCGRGGVDSGGGGRVYRLRCGRFTLFLPWGLSEVYRLLGRGVGAGRTVGRGKQVVCGSGAAGAN